MNLLSRGVLSIILVGFVSSAFAQNPPGNLGGLLNPGREKVPQSAKQAVPEKDAQEKAMTLIREVYKKEYDEAKTNEQKAELAKQLLEEGKNTHNDPAGRFVLFRVARDIAVGVGDYETAVGAIEELNRRYKVDAVSMKVEALSKVSKTPRPSDQQKKFVAVVIEAMDDSLAADRFADHKMLGEIALGGARRVRDATLTGSVVARLKEAGEFEKAYKEAQNLMAVLEKSPTDAEANMAVGRYRCFLKNDWANGLPMLALGDDPKIKKLAYQTIEEELSDLETADAWWEVAEGLKGVLQENVRRFAIGYYKKTLPTLSGLAKTKVERRIKEYPSREAKAASISDNEGSWLVIFRSADPSIWNKDVKGPNGFAMSLDKVSEDITFLRMAISKDKVVVIPITKEQLGAYIYVGRYNWNGGQIHVDLYVFGIVDNQLPANEKGDVIIGARNRGWGFGAQQKIGTQGYSWNGQPINPTVFEIAVRSGQLSNQEEKFLLKQ